MVEIPEILFPTEPQCRLVVAGRDGKPRAIGPPMSTSVAERFKARLQAKGWYREIRIEPMPADYLPAWKRHFREWLVADGPKHAQ
jgi:hypothetical protein